MMLGTVTALDQSNGLQIKLDGEEEGTKKKYSYLASYVPAVGDRVLIEEISGSYVVLGNLITDYSMLGVPPIARNMLNRNENEKNICFRSESGNFYIANNYGSWHKITTS